MSPDAVERFRSVLYTQGGDDIYGVIRMSVLRQVAPFDSYHWADRTFVAELALHGPFHNVPEFLYFRRDHPMRTTRVATGIRSTVRPPGPHAREPVAKSCRAPGGRVPAGVCRGDLAGTDRPNRPLAVREGVGRVGRASCRSEAPGAEG